MILFTASMLPTLLHPAFFRGKVVTFFIDNVGAVMALVKGKRNLAQLAKFAQTIHAVLNTLPWYEHVPSFSNASDGESRVGVHDSTARQFNIPLCDIAFSVCLYDIFDKGPMELIFCFEGNLTR